MEASGKPIHLSKGSEYSFHPWPCYSVEYQLVKAKVGHLGKYTYSLLDENISTSLIPVIVI